MTIDESKLEGFVHKVAGDVGATGTAALAVIGDRLGLYKAMAGAGAMAAGQDRDSVSVLRPVRNACAA